MALSGKLTGYIDISKKGDVFHDLYRHNPHEIAIMSPDNIHACDLVSGDRGLLDLSSIGTTLMGKKKVDKAIIEAINEENHMILYKVVGGDLMDDLYKTMNVILHVEKKGDAQVFVVTLEFEKLDISVPYPTSFMDWACNLIRELDAHSSTE